MSNAPVFHIPPGVAELQRDKYRFSQAVRLGNRVEISGQGGWDDELHIPASLADEVRSAFDNIETVLASAGAEWKDVISIESFRVATPTDPNGAEINRLIVAQFRERLGDRLPLWTEVGVAELGLPGMRVEIRATAVLQSRDA